MGKIKKKQKKDKKVLVDVYIVVQDYFEFEKDNMGAKNVLEIW